MEYPNSRLLVNVDWLRAHLDDEAVVVLDTRAGQSLLAYRQGHIPGALPFSLPHAQGLSGSSPDRLLEDAMREQMESLGIGSGQTVVLYDSALSTALTNCFWAFERMGHRQVRILIEGYQGWVDAEAPISQAMPPSRGERYQGEPDDERLATADWILSHVDEAQLLDARSPQEWLVARIASAINCPWDSMSCASPHGPSLRAADEIAQRIEELRLSPSQDTVTYCRSGGRASFLYFVLRLMGWEQVRCYDGSMNDWLLHQHPVERG